MEGLTFRYRRGRQPAIRDLSVELEAGEVLLVAGPSGCGKSTLIRAVNGLIPHAYPGDLTGSVWIDHARIAERPLREIARMVGTVLQDPAKQIVGSTVEAELAFGPENLGVPPAAIRDRIAAVMARAGIVGLQGRDTAALSGGERQLLAVAGALMLTPSLYVIDEPLANLDPATAARLMAILRELADEGHGVVIVEHRVEEALDLRPDRVLYLDAGEARYLGPVEGFFEVADPGVVKVPFEVALAHERRLARRAGLSEGWAATPKGAATNVGPPRLVFESVHVTLGDQHVLRGLSASLAQRQIVAVLGPNGSGKTTLFRTALRLLEPDAGTVTVDGERTTQRSVAQLARVLGYVFQSPSQMLFARTVREELLFGPRNLGLPHDDGFAMEALRRTELHDLEGILDRPPLSLSFGQQKRLALAIALALQPPTLVLDEPSAGQDHGTATRFMAAVAGIPGLESVYFVTHDVDLALTHADRILVIRDGQIAADGSPREVVQDEEAWRACNLRRTSLIAANLAWEPAPGRFLDAVTLARAVLAHELAGRSAGEARAAGEGG